MYKFIRTIFIANVLFLFGCQSLNSRFGIDSSDYANAQELSSLKLPADALVVSKRYDIPNIPSKDQHIIIDNDMPPDYYTQNNT